MATFSKKLHLRNTSNVEQTAEIYSTIGEAGDVYISTNVDNINGYIPLTTTSDSAATSGRVTHTNGNTYAIAVSGVPDYGYSRFTSGSGSFTVPQKITKLRVTCIGGGAGGYTLTYVSNGGGSSIGMYTNYGLAGGKTTFGSVTANGATAASITVETTAVAENWSTHYYRGYTISQGTSNGSGDTYTSSYFSGGAAVALTGYNGTSYGSYGAGGYADGLSGTYSAALSGASGYKTVTTISVTPGQTISYAVGAGSNGKANNTQYSSAISSGGAGVSPGSSGAILVEWGKGIQ